MNVIDLLSRGYFPKELPPCFTTIDFAKKFNLIENEVSTTEANSLRSTLDAIQSKASLSQSRKDLDKLRAHQIFRNQLDYSDCIQFTIPKVGLSRTTIKIPNPLHQSKVASIISENYDKITILFKDSNLSTSKPVPEVEIGEGKRSVTHETFARFREVCILNSYKYQIELKTDISKFYNSIYTHTIPWITFGGKEKYKRNRSLSNKDPNKQNSIYGHSIDNAITWCQNKQTMGIPIGPDTSLIVAEILACHLDKLLEVNLKRKKIDWVGYRYYDDLALYFNSELEAQYALSVINEILSEFELKINDEKTFIGKAANNLEKDWAVAIKSFHFRPSQKDQKEDIWNFFSIAFKYAKDHPQESVLQFALNKFRYVRIELENWDYFESLLFRLGLTDPSSLSKVAKIVVSYRPLVNNSKLKIFCSELIDRNYIRKHDYELTWSLWLLKEFNIQPTKEIYTKIFKSKSVCASMIALDLLNQNTRIKTFDYSDLEPLFSIGNLNKQNWLLIYETIYKKWIPFINPNLIKKHFYFNILRKNKVSFYDESKALEPLKVESSYISKIESKISQITKYAKDNDIKNQKIVSDIQNLVNLWKLKEKSTSTRENIQEKLEACEKQTARIISELEVVKSQQTQFNEKRILFVLLKRLEELSNLTTKELTQESKQDKELLFDPTYE